VVEHARNMSAEEVAQAMNRPPIHPLPTIEELDDQRDTMDQVIDRNTELWTKLADR
jgi:hypothetical protein